MNKKDEVRIPREIIRIITDRKHLDSEVDKNIRAGMNQQDAYNEVQSRVDYYVKGLLLFKSASSYWAARNSKLRKMLGYK